MKRILFFMAILLLIGLAFAQAIEPNWDITAWGTDVATLAGGVIAIMAILRRYVIKDLDGELVKIVAVIVGVLTGVALSFTPLLDGSILAGATHGLMGGLASFLGVDVVRDVVRGQGKAVPAAEE